MKKIIASLSLVTLLASCGNSGTSIKAPVVDSTKVVDSVKVDTVSKLEVK